MLGQNISCVAEVKNMVKWKWKIRVNKLALLQAVYLPFLLYRVTKQGPNSATTNQFTLFITEGIIFRIINSIQRK